MEPGNVQVEKNIVQRGSNRAVYRALASYFCPRSPQQVNPVKLKTEAKTQRQLDPSSTYSGGDVLSYSFILSTTDFSFWEDTEKYNDA